MGSTQELVHDWISPLLTGGAGHAKVHGALALTPLFGSDLVVWARDVAALAPEEALDLIAWMARSLVEATLVHAKSRTTPSA